MRYNWLFDTTYIATIKLYQKDISPKLAKWVSCKYYPSCSEYSILAVKKYGFRKGIKKTWIRLKRCRPDNFDTCIDFP